MWTILIMILTYLVPFPKKKKKEERNLLSFKIGYKLIVTFLHKVDIHGVMKYNIL